MTLGSAILLLVTGQRLGELALARANSARLLAAGAVEAGAAHYPLIVALHAGWLGGLWCLAPGAPVAPEWLVIFLILQALRLWVIATLGRRWTTRVIVMPGAKVVRSGPYRLLRHPNYCVVAGEILTLPLAFGLVWFALAFSLANAAVLKVRISVEERALAR